MPTGYTYKIEEEEKYTFKEYAKACARAFGGLIHMRDEPSDAPITLPPPRWDTTPEKIQETRDALASAKKDLKEFDDLNQAGRIAQLVQRNERAAEELEEGILRNVAKMEKYDSMRKQVEKWEPPTKEHTELKAFMLQQIETSVPNLDTRREELARLKDPVLESDVSIHRTNLLSYVQWEEETLVKRLSMEDSHARGAWVNALLKSIGEPELKPDED